MRNGLIFAALVLAAACPSLAQKPEQVPAPPPSSPEQGISLAPAERTESTPPIAPAGTEPQRRWSSFLPLMADEARRRGVDLPLPFGVSLVYYRLRVHPHFEIFTQGGTDFRKGWYFVLGPTARL